MYYSILYYIISYYIILYYIKSHYIILYYIILYHMHITNTYDHQRPAHGALEYHAHCQGCFSASTGSHPLWPIKKVAHWVNQDPALRQKDGPGWAPRSRYQLPYFIWILSHMLHGAGIFNYITGWFCSGKCWSIFQHHGSHMGMAYMVDLTNWWMFSSALF